MSIVFDTVFPIIRIAPGSEMLPVVLAIPEKNLKKIFDFPKTFFRDHRGRIPSMPCAAMADGYFYMLKKKCLTMGATQ